MKARMPSKQLPKSLFFLKRVRLRKVLFNTKNILKKNKKKNKFNLKIWGQKKRIMKKKMGRTSKKKMKKIWKMKMKI
jgi:hypothetical protein